GFRVSGCKFRVDVVDADLSQLETRNLKLFYCTCCPSICLDVAGSVPMWRQAGSRGDTKAFTVTSPTTTNNTPIARQTTADLRRALSPGVIPHLAQNSQ